MQIESIELSTSDLSGLETFYGSQLGLTTDRTEGTLTVTAGKTTLVFHEDDNLQSAYHVAFNIPENRLEAAIAWLQSRAIEAIQNGDSPIHNFQDWNADAVYFRDPAGNILELITRHELDNPVETSEPFSSKEILNVSEIGIACDDVLQTANQMKAEYDLEPYRSPSDQFAPIGDANGLFILVPAGRIWHPDTGVLAQALPLKVSFSVCGNPHSFHSQCER